MSEKMTVFWENLPVTGKISLVSLLLAVIFLVIWVACAMAKHVPRNNDDSFISTLLSCSGFVMVSVLLVIISVTFWIV